MGRNELISPTPDFGGFQFEIEYNDGFTPNEMAGRTAEIINDYFRRDPNWKMKSIFLARQTLPFVQSAKQGFLDNPQAVRNLSLIDPDNLKAFKEMNNRSKEDAPNTDDSEAFSRMYIGFGMVPEMAVQAGLPKGFSRIQLLEPPFTTAEVLGRINEVGVTVRRLKNGLIDQDEDILNLPGLLRTYWTFKAIETIPLKTPEVA